MTDIELKPYVAMIECEAKPMTLGVYNELLGRPTDLDWADPAERGYFLQSEVAAPWIPEELFPVHYKGLGDQMSFSHALAYLKQGARIARASWANGIYLHLDNGIIRWINSTIQPQKFCCEWTAGQESIMADDWRVV